MIIFRKLYIRLKPENEGIEKFSIIKYGRFPYLMGYTRLSPEEDRVKTYEVESITRKYRHYLEIDLWLIFLRFNWTDRKFRK